MGRHLKTDFGATPRQVYSRIPIFVGMIFEEKINEYNLFSRAAVISCLCENYTNQYKGLAVSPAASKIFRYLQQDRPRIISFAPTMSMNFMLPGNISVELSKAAEASGFISRHHLINALVMAFCVAPPRYGRLLSEELNGKEQEAVNGKIYFSTYTSHHQYRILKEKAQTLNLSISGLLKTAIDVLFNIESSDYFGIIPENIIHNIKACMAIQGSTVKRFNRDIAVTVIIPPDDQVKVFCLMKKYGIHGPREFTRRMILFFLNSDLYEDTRVVDQEEEEDNNYWFEQMEKKDFVREVYLNNYN